MTEYPYQTSEAWNSAVKLASAVGRLKVASNLKAVGEAQQKSFEQAGLAAAFIGEAAMREPGQQAGLYREAIGALAQSRAWLHIIADLVNEPDSLFSEELELADKANKQVWASIRAGEMRERGPSGPGGPGGSGGYGGGGYGGPRRSGPPPGRDQRPGFRPGGRP